LPFSHSLSHAEFAWHHSTLALLSSPNLLSCVENVLIKVVMVEGRVFSRVILALLTG
jgi:hypothetical protein